MVGDAHPTNPVARLLVSVRSESEARAALVGGAAIIDVKEPSRGSLGMAPCAVWRAVRRAVPSSVTVSVALGELLDWSLPGNDAVPGRCWSGIDYRKVGLAGAGPTWRQEWRALRERVAGAAQPVDYPRWVAVVYLDWEMAHAPNPLEVIDEGEAAAECAGILFDTWDKSPRVAIDRAWTAWIDRAKRTGRFVALAGSLDEDGIRRLRRLGPDIFAVRGAACQGGDRNAPIDAERVARLVEAAGG